MSAIVYWVRGLRPQFHWNSEPPKCRDSLAFARLSRDPREPEEIFYAVLDEGEEMTLVNHRIINLSSRMRIGADVIFDEVFFQSFPGTFMTEW